MLRMIFTSFSKLLSENADVSRCYLSLLTGILVEFGLIYAIRDLSFNELYGDIPFSISKLKQLEQL